MGTEDAHWDPPILFGHTLDKAHGQGPKDVVWHRGGTPGPTTRHRPGTLALAYYIHTCMVKLEPTEIIYSMHRLGTLKLAIIIWTRTRHTGSNRYYLGTKEAQ